MYLKNRAYYRVEFNFVLAMINAYKNNGRILRFFNDIDVWKKNVYNWGPSIYDYFDWDDLKITTYGQEGDNEIVVFYQFPEPFRSPLAVYGAIVIKGDSVNYYTFELSLEGDYVLGSKNEFVAHMNFGNYPSMSPEEFLNLVCSMEDIALPHNK